mgnify:CR=1 FL=1
MVPIIQSGRMYYCVVPADFLYDHPEHYELYLLKDFNIQIFYIVVE